MHNLQIYLAFVGVQLSVHLKMAYYLAFLLQLSRPCILCTHSHCSWWLSKKICARFHKANKNQYNWRCVQHQIDQIQVFRYTKHGWSHIWICETESCSNVTCRKMTVCVSVFRILVMCVCVSFSHDRWHNASGPLSWHFDIFSKTNKSELCTAGIGFSLIFLGFRLCFWCTDEIGIGWYSLTCTVHTIENARRFFLNSTHVKPGPFIKAVQYTYFLSTIAYVISRKTKSLKEISLCAYLCVYVHKDTMQTEFIQ